MIDFFNPTRIISGEGCFKNYRGFSQFGKKCAIVTGGRSAKLCGAYDDAVAALRQENIEFMLYDKIMQNPLVDTCLEGGLEAAAFGAQFIIGIGGGSPLDAAKAVAAYAANPGIDKLAIFEQKPRNKALPVLAVGTTAGTGSEVTPYSILTVPEFGNKRSFAGDDIFPAVAFLDPVYTYSLPYEFTAATAVDALCHSVEGYFSVKADEITDALADRANAMLADGLRYLKTDGITNELRAKLLYGSTVAGTVISRTGTGFVHSLGYNMTYRHDIAHGIANAYYLPDFMLFMEEHDGAKTKKLLRCLGFESAADFGNFIRSFFAPQLKLTPAQIDEYADITMTAKNMTNTTAKADRAYIRALLAKIHG